MVDHKLMVECLDLGGSEERLNDHLQRSMDMMFARH